MPSHPFLLSVRPDGSFTITADQLRTSRQSYVNALLTASRGQYFVAALRSHLHYANEAFTPSAAPRALPPGLGGITM
ncbi:hypothetical protein KCU65_g9981, partial [Aureobasidium melanogenum]